MIGLRGKIIIQTASGGWVKNSMDLGWSSFATHSLLMPRLNVADTEFLVRRQLPYDIEASQRHPEAGS